VRDTIENEKTSDDPEEMRKKETLDKLSAQLNGLRGDVLQLERDLEGSGGSQEEADGLLYVRSSDFAFATNYWVQVDRPFHESQS